ncbi:MAG: signal peptidase I [Parcubacteria group bacterium Gr01-1014_31]|nr:MAG: signal peptidase I [Parcubacteria group bacterium Gr01-1014_31]
MWRDALVFVWELVKVVGISLAIIVPIRYFLIQPFYVKGASMEPSFTDHEYLIIDEITYRFRQPKRGEVVVFRYPLNPRDYFIKRIVGLPGEQVQISDGKVLVTPVGQDAAVALDETYLPAGTKVDGAKTVKLADDEFFLLGDNRAESLDSRYFGAVNRRFITGRVFLRGWPLAKLDLFLEPPDYNLP